ncbi:hypothetical protein P7D22_20065 [Lichenihabitans sp. Uapishka_5]|uniref:hypothetical protein n=1 Tax=Lichenihabitans sp. Uapishka_5 TaxID=3037302 RepID=UPI0029E7F748|nr:hypothetical protein [Lichenihabitans sp. Uapishka_5]MDX7953465.1 hypothetical protein [Lichenihabitans sp. Uapishka_5]
MVDLGIMVVSVTMEMEVAMVVTEETEETAEAMEEVGIERQETQFAEIRVSQNILSKDYRKLKRVSLPIVIHGPGADWRYFPFAFLLAYAGFVNLAQLQTHKGQHIGGAGLLVIAVLMLVTTISRYRLGPGTVLIEAIGFQDSRISLDFIPWSACEGYFVYTARKLGPTPGITLRMKTDVPLPRLSSTYRWTFLMPLRKNKPLLYLDLRGTGQVEDMVAVVKYLVGKHGGKPC